MDQAQVKSHAHPGIKGIKEHKQEATRALFPELVEKEGMEGAEQDLLIDTMRAYFFLRIAFYAHVTLGDHDKKKGWYKSYSQLSLAKAEARIRKLLDLKGGELYDKYEAEYSEITRKLLSGYVF